MAVPGIPTVKVRCPHCEQIGEYLAIWIIEGKDLVCFFCGHPIDLSPHERLPLSQTAAELLADQKR